MGGRYDIAQRVKELLEASDPLKYGDAARAQAIELSAPPQLSPDPHLSALTPPLPSDAPPPPPTPPAPPMPPPPARVATPPPAPYGSPPAAAQVAPPLGQDELAELVALLRDGRTIMAVKRYRELTGAGLSEAKAAVAGLELEVEDPGFVVPPSRLPAAPSRAPFAAPASAAPAAVPDWLQPVVAQVRRGDTIAAIAAYRRATGVGLSEARATVEGLARQLGANAAVESPARRGLAPDLDALAEEVVGLVRRGRKIEAIERYREVTDAGPREAQDAVDAIEERLNAWPR